VICTGDGCDGRSVLSHQLVYLGPTALAGLAEARASQAKRTT